MAMHQEMTQIFGVVQKIAAERQNFRNLLRPRRLEPWRFLNDIVEFQLKPGMLAVCAEGFGLRLLRIEDRENMRDPAFCMPCKLFQPANCDYERSTGWHFRSSHF